jgi:glycosyltransferase involved in cell wall biosynthesis
VRVLVLSSVFPNPKRPTLGVFVRERLRRVADHCEVRVVAPLLWFPGNRHIRGDAWSDIPHVERQGSLVVHHPRFFCVPRYLKWTDATFYAASLLPFLARLRASFPFDLIDAHFAYPDGAAAVLLGKALRRPVVITLRGSLVRLMTYPSHRPQLKFALSRASRVVAVSRSLKAAAVELGIPADGITVIPNGVDADVFFPIDRRRARLALGLPQDRTIILSVGGLNEGKGHHRIIGLLPSLLRDRPELLYVVVGAEHPADNFRTRLERMVRQHGLERHVLLAGARPHPEIRDWLGAADLFCLATRSEGWANVLLEALACGRPVVTTRVGGNPEIIEDDRLGLLVPPGDDAALRGAILRALDEPWDQEHLIAHARAYSWEHAALRVMDEFRSAFGTRSDAAANAWRHQESR